MALIYPGGRCPLEEGTLQSGKVRPGRREGRSVRSCRIARREPGRLGRLDWLTDGIAGPDSKVPGLVPGLSE